MLDTARTIATKVDLDACFKPNACVIRRPRIVIGGAGVSGPAFIDNAEFRQWIYNTFTANVVDNESASVAHVAYSNHIPFIAFRSLSDLAGGEAGENTENDLEHLASNNAAVAVRAFLRALPGK